MKVFCTDSDEGRELVDSTQDWIETEIGRFHRILSLAILVLAIFLIAVATTRHHTTIEIAVEIVGFAITLALIIWFARGLKSKAKPVLTLIPLTPWHEGQSHDPTQRPRPAP